MIHVKHFWYNVGDGVFHVKHFVVLYLPAKYGYGLADVRECMNRISGYVGF